MSSDVRKIIDPGAPYSRTLKQYSIDEKLAIISHAKNHGNRAAGREFNVAESSIREWRKNEMKLLHNKNTAASIRAPMSSTYPSLSTGPTNSNNNNITSRKNNNHNHNRNGNLQQSLFTKNQHPQNGGIFGIKNENGVLPSRAQEELMKIQLIQLAMLNMDVNHLAQLAPLLQLQQQQRQLQAQVSAQNIPTHPQPLSESTSTNSSVAGTPSSTSSASTPPPSLSPIPSGSGRRKLKCPQKIVEATEVFSTRSSNQIEE